MLTLSRSVHVSLAYRCWNNQWSQEENRRRYGLQASAEGLGGNWLIEIGRSDEREDKLEPQLAQLKGLLDHRCLFTHVEEFHSTPSTLENVTVWLGKQLFNGDPGWSYVTIHENDRTACTVQADGRPLQLSLRILNLTMTLQGVPDESGLMTSRDLLTQLVIRTLREFENVDYNDFETWGNTLFATFQSGAPGLKSLRVDLGGGKYIVVKSKSFSS